MGEAMKIGICSIVSECGLGYLTQPREEFVENHVVSTINAMKHVGTLRTSLLVPRALLVACVDISNLCTEIRNLCVYPPGRALDPKPHRPRRGSNH